MPVDFPTIQPTSRRFTGGKWPNSGSRSQDGTRTKRRWGDKPSDAMLDLQFANIFTTQADLIDAAFDAAFGGIDYVELPALIFKGDTGMLARSDALLALGLRWYFIDEEPPDRQSVVAGITTVACRLRCEIRPS